MGDGRYYTYFQFIDILILTGLAALSISSFLFFLYRKNNEVNIFYIITPVSISFLFVVLRIVESVIPNLKIAYELREIEILTLLIIGGFCSFAKKCRKREMSIILIFSLILIALVLSLKVLIKQYEFHGVHYSIYYKGIIIFLAFAISGFWLFDQNKKLKIYKLFFLNIPFCIYTCMIIFNNQGVCYMEMILSLCVIVYANLVFRADAQSAYSTLAFNKIGNISTDYMFVLDNENKVIYSNDYVKRSEFFWDFKYIEKVTDIFKGYEVRKYTHLQKEYINIKKDLLNYYFAYTYSELYNDEKTIGKILTLTNITDLIVLLNDLEDKKAESKAVNEELENYSKVVYYIEKEKEINHLLENIVLTRDKQVEYLSKLIGDAKEKMNTDTFEKAIDGAIEKSNEILDDVRKTVNKYRDYYGG